ncbi:MAG: hypothetical protein ACRDNG_02255 [Gaiellaceae bacterium]
MTLPVPERHDLPAEATIAVPVPPDGFTVYRLLRGPDPRQEDFEPDYTRPQAQLRRIPELSRVSISHWIEQEQALARSRQREVCIARVELRPAPLSRVALTERGPHGEPRPGHVDVWGYPKELLASVIDVVVVER